MGSLPIYTRELLEDKKSWKRIETPVPPAVTEIFTRKALNRTRSKMTSKAVRVHSVSSLKEEKLLYRALFEELNIKSSYHSDVSNFVIPSWDTWEKDDWDKETTLMPHAHTPCNELWTSQLITRSPNSEINGFKGSYSPVSNDSFGDRETIIIRLTRQKPFSSPLRSPVAYNCTPDSQLRSIDSSGVWDFLQSPSCTTTAAFSSSSSGISSCSELFVAEDKGLTKVIRRIYHATGKSKRVSYEDILTVDLEESEYLDLPIPYRPLVYSRFFTPKLPVKEQQPRSTSEAATPVVRWNGIKVTPMPKFPKHYKSKWLPKNKR